MKTDTVDDERKLSELLERCESLPDALEIAQKLLSLAVGASERISALNELGRAYYLLQRYEDAHSTWMSANTESKKLVSKGKGKELLQNILSNLLISYTVRNEYTKANEILEEVEKAFPDDSVKLGASYYTRAKMEEHAGNIKKAREHAFQSLHFYEQTGQPRRIGRAKVTLAHYDYLNMDYEASVHLLQHATELLEPYKLLWITSVKEYAKSLIKTGDFNRAKEAIMLALSSSDSSFDPNSDVIGKLRILLSICTNERAEAERVLSDTQMSKNIKFLAYRHLHHLCLQNSDKDSLMKYAIIVEQLGINKHDVMDEEEF